ncbi:MAG: S8 family serine peptidase [Deinococcales bacterium]
MYGFYQGTSMASPHIAGNVALMKAAKPDLDLAHAVAYLQNTATGLSGSCDTLGCGAGLVDAAAAVNAAKNNDPIGAILAADAVDFGRRATTATLALRNLGDARTNFNLSINSSSITPSLTSGGIAPGAVRSITLTLDRSAFNSGSYIAFATVSYGSKEVIIPILFQKGQINDIGTVYVELYIDVGGGYYALLNNLSTDTSLNYAFNFDSLMQGNYALVGYGYNSQGSQAIGITFLNLAEGESLTDQTIELALTSTQTLPFKIIPQGKP